jgi:hypothetical protein
MLHGEISNTSNLSWIKRIDKYLISLRPIGDMGEKAWETMPMLWRQKNGRQF